MPYRFYKFIFSVTLLLFISVCSKAQVFPVAVNTTVRGPFSLNLSDYASPAYDRIQTNLYMADLTKVNYPVKIRLIIRSTDGINISTIPGQEVGPIFLNGGQNVLLTGADLNQLFNVDKLLFSGISLQQYKQNAALPEGIYQMTFEVVDYNLNVVISNTTIGFATAWLILNDPPLINKPENISTVVPSLQQNIFFQWTPRHTGSPNSAFTTVYDIQMVEVYPAGRNPNDAMLTSPVIFEKTVFSTSYNYTIMDPYLFPGRWYAFRVRARDMNNLDLFKNQGYSEVYSFFYGAACPMPQNIQTENLDQTSELVYWDAQNSHLSTDIQYKAESARNWTTMTVFNNRAELKDLTPGEKYIFKLVGKCEFNLSSPTEEMTFTMPGGGGNGGGAGDTCGLPLEENVTATAINSNTVQITWSTENWFTEYEFKYRPVGSQLFSSSSAKSAFVQIENLDQDIIYEYQIRYHCVDKGKDIWVDGNINTFRINPYVNSGGGTGDCFPPLDISDKVYDDLSVSISWPKDKDTDSYRIYWRIKDSKSAWDSISTSKTEVIIKNLKADTDYEYQICAVCKSGNLSIPSDIQNFSTKFILSYSGPCEAPILKAPTLISNTEVKLDWEPKNYYTGYVVEYRKSPSSPWVAFSTKQVPSLVSNLSSATLYDYHVKAFCGTKLESDYSVIDTFSTKGLPDGQFECGSSQGLITITNRTPIASLSEGDKFKAADFELEVKSLTSSNPYNGEAKTNIPYLKNSSFIFGMENVRVNELNEMYEGKVYLKMANFRIIDEKLANQISSYVDKLDAGMTMASTYLTMADSIQDALNEIIQTVNEPIDMSQYDGWTMEQLFAEGRRLFTEGSNLIRSGSPTSIAQAKQMIIKGIQLIKTAIALGHQTAQYGKALDILVECLTELKQEYSDSISIKEQQYNTSKALIADHIITEENEGDNLQQYQITEGNDLTEEEINSLPADLQENIENTFDYLEKESAMNNKKIGKSFSDYYLGHRSMLNNLAEYLVENGLTDIQEIHDRIVEGEEKENIKREVKDKIRARVFELTDEVYEEDETEE